MILKFLLVVAIIAAVYFMFFKKKPDKVKHSKKDEEISSEMVECTKCSTYISIDEAILSNSNYYCSKECLKA